MAATCAYATAQRDHQPEAEQLAALFCEQARHRIAEHRRACRFGHQKRVNRLATAVLAGEHRWLETGIVPAATATAASQDASAAATV